MDEELERFKCDIKLHEYAASLAYEIDQHESSKREIVMRRGGDKISVRRDIDGHYVYYSFRDENDHGTILDFIKARLGKTLGGARVVLRPFRAGTVIAYQHLEPAPRFNRKRPSNRRLDFPAVLRSY
jgi:hypothetical protein